MHGQAASLASYPSGHIEGFADAFKNVFRQFYSSLTASDGVYEYATLRGWSARDAVAVRQLLTVQRPDSG